MESLNLIPPGVGADHIRTPSRNSSQNPGMTGSSRSPYGRYDDNDSLYSSNASYIEPDDASDSGSIVDAEGLFNLVEQLGRLYLENTEDDTSAYVLPVDGVSAASLSARWRPDRRLVNKLLMWLTQREQDRLDFQDAIIKALTNCVNHVPLVHPGRILDIGTGTGVWAEAIAQKYPDAEVVATDLFPILSKYKDFPPNLKFYKEDATEADWGDAPFSYIHTRMMLGCFTDFKAIIQRSFDYLEPGGHMECVELDSKLFCNDGTVRPDNALLEWSKLQADATFKIGRPIRIANKLKKWYEECGFVDVREEVYNLPINPWPKDPRLKFLGKCWAKQLVTGLSAFSLRPFQAAFGWDQTTTEVAIVNAKRSIEDKSIHGFHKIYAVWGRKPANAVMKSLPLTDAPTPTNP